MTEILNKLSALISHTALGHPSILGVQEWDWGMAWAECGGAAL